MKSAPARVRVAVFGAGFWARYQLAAWRELAGVELVAIYNRSRARAEAVALQFGIPGIYDDPTRLLTEARPDVVDNITEVGGHKPLSLVCARHRVPCICQKPMAASLADGRAMVAAFHKTGTPFFIHENWRWQTPMRELRRVLAAGTIGTPLRARLMMVTGFDVWANQPALRQLDQFILTDLGSHILDVARVLFGEARSLYCQTRRTLAPGVRGENLATLLLSMGEAATTVVIETGYAKTPLEPSTREAFPQTFAFVEGTAGSIELSADYLVRVTTRTETRVTRHAPPRYSWADPNYDLAHASIVECHRDLRDGLLGRKPAETTGEDNLRTLELVFAAYTSAARDCVVRFRP